MNPSRSKPISPIVILFALLASLLGSAVFVTPARAAGVIINNDADVTATDDGFCTLREAIDNANNDAQMHGSTSGECAAGSGTDMITFEPVLAGLTIQLSSPLVISSDITIDGSALTSQLTISGEGSVRVFSVNSGTVTLNSLKITNGSALNGGGIFNSSGATLTITNSTLSGNSAQSGSGIYNLGLLTVTNSTLSGNAAVTNGGGIYNDSNTLTVTNSTFSGNSAAGSGGGIYNNGGTLAITNSTFSGNSAVTSGGGIYNNGGALNYANTIIANSTFGGDCAGTGTIGTNINNLVEDVTSNCGAAINGVYPNLGPLADNGGPTQTFALLANSPAIDAGDDATCAAAPVSNLDQRGTARPTIPNGSGGAHCDIGAYEYLDTTAPSVTVFNVPASPTTLKIPITTFTVSEDAILTGYLITQSATPPAVGAAGWTASAPTTYPVASMGSYMLYPWAKDAAGHVSAVYGPATVNIACLNPITVTSSADSGPGTLRQAIADACMGDLNNITFIDFNSALSGSTITLTSQLDLLKNLTIDGSDLDEPITISGGDSVRVFNVPSIFPVLALITLDSLNVIEGATSGGGAGLSMEQGRHVIIKNSTFSDNHAGGDGGGIRNQGSLTLMDSTISGNSSAGTGGGGGVDNESGATITNSTVSHNTASGFGAGGGGVANFGPLVLINSMLFGNSTTDFGHGGGLSSTHNLTITNTTIAGNSAWDGGGIEFAGNTTNLRNTIIAGNSASLSSSDDDCRNNSASPLTTNINNLIEDGSCSPFLRGDPGLAPALADNGGPTQTLALLAGSNAIDAGDDTTCAAAVGLPNNGAGGLDQRGMARPNSAHCDIGAYEYADASNPVVTVFAVPSPANSLNIPITTFTASDDATVAGYLITQTSTSPSPSAPGWTASAPTTYNVGSAGSYTLYAWAKDAVNNVSPLFSPSASVTVDLTAPTVVSSVRANTSPTNAASVDFTVTFSESVTGVDAADFTLITTGVINNASITGVSGSGATRTVSVNTGSGIGTIRLDMLDTIQDAAGNTLNGDFTSGESYTIDKSITLTLMSLSSQDGWVLESSETSGTGGITNGSMTTFRIGDDADRKQYRNILSFKTSAIPDTAVITAVTLKVKRQGVVGGGNPVNIFQGFMVDIKKGLFGTSALQAADFQTKANQTYGPFKPSLVSSWYSINLTTGKAHINKLTTSSGLTQVRLRLKLDDNNNSIANYLSLFSGNAGMADRPQLVITYYVP